MVVDFKDFLARLVILLALLLIFWLTWNGLHLWEIVSVVVLGAAIANVYTWNYRYYQRHKRQ